jgi:hypothetical protein
MKYSLSLFIYQNSQNKASSNYMLKFSDYYCLFILYYIFNKTKSQIQIFVMNPEEHALNQYGIWLLYDDLESVWLTFFICFIEIYQKR